MTNIEEVRKHPYYEQVLSLHFVRDHGERLTFIREEIKLGRQRYHLWLPDRTDGLLCKYYFTTTGVVVVWSPQSRKVVTAFVARPGQLYRLWKEGGREGEPPSDLMDIARDHEMLGYHLIG